MSEILPLPGAVSRNLSDGSRDEMIREEPLSIRIGEDQLLTMRTPGDDENLAIGFLLSEGVIADVAAITGLDLRPGDSGVLRADTIELSVPSSAAMVKGKLTRTHEIRASCGICGLTDPDELLEELPPLLPGVPGLSAAAIASLREQFEAAQPHFHATGACHGAMIFSADGAVWGHGEDVGRHNALDKAIGMAARAGHDLGRGVAILSGRAGYDLVVKCLRMRIPAILSISAPSALAFDLCNAAGATLIGFLREHRMKVSLDGGRLSAGGPGD